MGKAESAKRVREHELIKYGCLRSDRRGQTHMLRNLFEVGLFGNALEAVVQEHEARIIFNGSGN